MNEENSMKLVRMLKLFFMIQHEAATNEECDEYQELYDYFNNIITKYESFRGIEI